MLIVRHGESEWNREGRWQGWIDIAPTPEGEAQARARGTELHEAGHRFVSVHSSDLSRAARTAEIMAAALESPAAIRDDALRERFGGDWQGKTRDEIIERWPEERAAWRRGELRSPPGGEADTEVLARVRAALAGIDATAPPGPVLVVTHHGVVRQLASWAGVDARDLIPNLGGRWFDWDGSVLHPLEPLPPLAPTPPR